jgi:hypothetical protein
VGITSVICMLFIIIVYCFPASPSPNGQTMNYMAVVLGGWLLLSLAFYYMPIVGGVHWFKGPISNVNVGDENTPTAEKAEEEKVDEQSEKTDMY